MAQLLCKNLTVGYGDGAVANDINFKVDEGDYLCILGENGSGKTTLMKTLLGLIKPICGEIIFDDYLNSKEIGYLPQQTQVQRDFPASVEEIVISGCLNRERKNPFYTKESRKKAFNNMKRLGIDTLASKSYRSLSGGQQQRVLLARALCAAERMLLLDEPTAGLDSTSTSDMYRYIENLNKEGMSVIMISHDFAAAVKYASHILDFCDDKVYFATRTNYMKRHGL